MRVAIILLGLALVVAFASYWFVLAFSESVHFSSGSLKYHLLLKSNVIGECPQISPTGPPTFYSSCGDGNKPRANGIAYLSEEDRQTLESEFLQYFEKQGFTVSSIPASLITYYEFEKLGSSAVLQIEDQPNGAVQITVTEYFK